MRKQIAVFMSMLIAATSVWGIQETQNVALADVDNSTPVLVMDTASGAGVTSGVDAPVVTLNPAEEVEDTAMQGVAKIDGGVLNSIDYPQAVEANSDVICGYTVPKEVTKINTFAFSGLQGLDEVICNEGLVTIGESAFASCVSLEHVVLPESLETIEITAFNDCKFMSIDVPAKVSSIGYCAFPKGCTLNVVGGSYAETYAKENGYDYLVNGELHEGNGTGGVDTRTPAPIVTLAPTVNVAKASVKSVKKVSATSMKVTLKKVEGAKGYIITYATDKSFKKSKTTKVTKLTTTIKKLKKGKTYYVKAVAYTKIGNKTVKGKASAVKKVVLK